MDDAERNASLYKYLSQNRQASAAPSQGGEKESCVTHNLKVVSSNLAPATNPIQPRSSRPGFFFARQGSLRGGGRAAFGSRAVFRNAASQPGIDAGPHPDNEAMKGSHPA